MSPSIVQQVTGSATASYGVSTTAITSSKGNALFAFIGWNCVTNGTAVSVPSASVTDSPGNLWKQIGISRGGPGITSSTRCAVWATTGAQPVNWVSVGIAGYSASAAWTIVEVTGLAQAINIDYSISVNSGNTAPTLTGIATGADIGFALFASGNSSQTITAPGGGWTALTSGAASTGSAATGMKVFPYWNTGITAGTATVAAAFGTVSSYSYVLCTIAANASPPAQYDYRFPLIVTEAAFGATPGNYSSSLDYTFSSEYVTWTDISTRVIGDAVSGRISTSRGRQYELQQEESGQMTAYLDNHDGAFTPTNPGSPYYSNALNSEFGFQNGLGDWSGFNGATLSQSTAFTFATGLNAAPVYSMLITTDGVSSSPGALENNLIPVNQNYQYSESFWVYSPVGYASGIALTIQWYNSSRSPITGSTSTHVSVPAGAWTNVSWLNLTPASGAAYALAGLSIAGVPGTAVTFYVAEFGVVTGTAVTTGLVSLLTPMRITCWWHGTQYPLWSGYVERWPQSWPEMPQWGFSQITATDAIAVAAANSMNSALIGEVLLDNPYAYLPCNEQYTTATVGATPADPFFFAGSPSLAPTDANGQIALNKAVGNQAVGVYFDGKNQQVGTGLAINFLGDNGTGMGASGYNSAATGQAAPSMQYTDNGLSSITTSSGSSGFTVEFWFTYDSTNAIELLTGFGPPSSFTVDGTAVPNGASILVNISSGSLFVEAGNSSVGTPFTPSANPQQCVFTISSGNNPTVTGWLNGVNMGSLTGGFTVQVNTIVLGPGRYSYDCQVNDFTPFYNAFNYAAGHLAIYGYQLPAGRIAAHYQAGAFGWQGVSAGQRFAQILDWAQLGLKRGGYLQSGATGTAEITRIGPAYQLSGSSASDAINSVAQSEGGQYFVRADGSLVYLERTIAYNQVTQAILGDNATAAPDISNPNPQMEINQGVGWSATGTGTVTYQPSMLYGPMGTLLYTPGATATSLTISPQGPVVPGGTYTTGAWVYSAAGGSLVTTGAAWTGGSTIGTNVLIPGSSWTYIQTVNTIPAGVTRASAAISSGTFPLYIAAGALAQVSAEVPYVKETEFDYDNTYLYNEVTATLQDGPNQLTVYDNRNLLSEQQYFRRSALSITSNVVSPYDVSDFTTWSISQFAQPFVRVSSVKINASANPIVSFPVILNLDIGDIILVNRRPIGGAIISELGIIERITYDIGARYFYVTYQVSAYQPSNNVLCADTAGFDTPGTTILAW